VNNSEWTAAGDAVACLLPMSARNNRILHIDGDSFFASCEIALDPKLEGRPVWVGGGRRGDGIVIAANRQAKKYGIKTGTACFEAKRLCPSGVLCRPHYDAYRELSRQMFLILEQYAPTLVPYSIDEGFLDFSSMDTHVWRNTTPTDYVQAKLKGVVLLRDDQVWHHDLVSGSCRVIPKRGVVLVVTDAQKRETVFGFFQFPAALKDMNGKDVVTTHQGERWTFQNFVNSPDPRFRKIVKRFFKQLNNEFQETFLAKLRHRSFPGSHQHLLMNIVCELFQSLICHIVFYAVCCWSGVDYSNAVIRWHRSCRRRHPIQAPSINLQSA
jgi:hypothetical protein